ncbi:uncharacterized protein LOC134333020 [Trichomycterus rosablanca]|uniref:uncharacterized protein LOC134333020 n=1 Tax=Trichomycterus rosablanca TaxID=2290929 RepID=UPI002F354869
MEDLQDSSFSGPSAMSIASELKDDLYFRLVDDFLGPQTGNLLNLDEKPFTNRLLVQVGLIKENNNASWSNIVKWLQKIFPVFQSADFHGLISRNTATAMSLTGDSRESFLQANVNFDFVGPICDSTGISRTDLLEMSDFSDRAKLTEVTNGLILELTNFIEREKIDPVVLVMWLRNFDPTFCSDGKIRKANKLLQTSLKRFRIQYRNSQRSRNRSSGLSEEFLQSPFDLTSDLGDSEFIRVSINKAHLKRKSPQLTSNTPNLQKRKLKEENETCDISPGFSKCKTESEGDCNETPRPDAVKEEFNPQSINTEPLVVDKKVDTQTDTGDCLTLLDISVLSLQKLTSMYGEKSESAKLVCMDLLKNQFALMVTKDLNMKSLNEKIMPLVEDYQLVPPVKFLQCTTLFIYNFIDTVEKQIMSYERDIVSTTGGKLGRDKNPNFTSFVNFDESSITRYIHMACEILCSKRETKNSYRRHWLAFCIERNNPSRLPVNQSNQLINYFEAAAALVHHYKDVALFVSDLQLLNDDSDIFLDSVSSDASDEVILALVGVVAVLYCKVLGPFWQLLKSEAQYLLFSKYFNCLYKKLLEWSQDASSLMQPEPMTNVFLQVPLQEKTFTGVFEFCSANADNQYGTLMKACLQRMMQVLAAVMENNLKDFLPGGQYCKEASVELAEQLAGCTLNQFMGEYPFGHAYSYSKNRPDQTNVGTEKEGDLLEESDRQGRYSQPEKKSSPKAPSAYIKKDNPKSKPYIMFDRANLRSVNKMKKKRKNKQKKAQTNDQLHKKTILAALAKHGGPCKSVEDVNLLLRRLEGLNICTKRDAIRSELNYLKVIVGCKDKRLNCLGICFADMVEKLKNILLSIDTISNVVTQVGSAEVQSVPEEQAVEFENHQENVSDEFAPIV